MTLDQLVGVKITLDKLLLGVQEGIKGKLKGRHQYQKNVYFLFIDVFPECEKYPAVKFWQLDL